MQAAFQSLPVHFRELGLGLNGSAILLYLFNALLVSSSWYLTLFSFEFGYLSVLPVILCFYEVLFDYRWIQFSINIIYALKLNYPCPL